MLSFALSCFPVAFLYELTWFLYVFMYSPSPAPRNISVIITKIVPHKRCQEGQKSHSPFLISKWYLNVKLFFLILFLDLIYRFR